MRYQVEKSSIQVIGNIWMPNTECGYEYPLSRYDLENIGKWTRENFEQWLLRHSGDFQSITDFRVDVSVDGKDFVSDWQNEESEYKFSDAVFGEVD